jgi:hypothetical protein
MNTKSILVALLMLSLLLGCKKSRVNAPQDIDTAASQIESLRVSDSFNWRTHKEVTFTLESEEAGIASITSTQKSNLTHYRVRMIPGQKETFTVAIPAYENTVQILFKDQLFEVEIADQGHISHTFVTDKSAPASVPQPLARTGR